jgi:flavin reductase (DIM6/NTAB) family NADH-FMN oxidoreductase RutF
MIIDFKDKSPLDKYKLMSNLIIPRPIAWIVTGEKVVNIAPFSYFTPLSSNPPVVVVSIGHKNDGSQKDTLRNLKEFKKCVICMIDEAHIVSMHLSSKSLGKDESEAEVFDIELEKIVDNYPPIPKNIKVAFFCEYYQEIELNGSKTIPIIVEIKHLYTNKEIITDQESLKVKFDAIARVGSKYSKLSEEIEAPLIP